MIAKLLQLPPLFLQAAGMGLVALVLLGASLAFGLFGSKYDLNGPYDQLYPVTTPATPEP